MSSSRLVPCRTCLFDVNLLLRQDGTINYLTLPAVTDGLRFLSAYLPFLPLRLATLLNYTISSLSLLRHDSTGAPVVKILSRIPLRRLTHVGDQSDTGSTISMIFLSVCQPTFLEARLIASYSLLER